MNKTMLFTGLAAAAGLLAVYAWRAEAPTVGDTSSTKPAAQQVAAPADAVAATAPAGSADVEIAELHRRLDDEIRARRKLAGEVEALRRQVAGLQPGAEPGAANSGRARSQPGLGDGAADAPEAWFDEQALIDAGMDSLLADELKVFFEGLELERLQLRDLAAREGWDRARRREGLDALDNRELQLRERLGESGYEAYLYAAGRPNRIAISSVLASAPAGQAGIRPGDHILRYADQRIYDRHDLREAMRAGNVGEPVEVEVDRAGETLQFYLARGPMGVRTDALSLAP